MTGFAKIAWEQMKISITNANSRYISSVINGINGGAPEGNDNAAKGKTCRKCAHRKSCATRLMEDVNASKNLRLYGEIVSATEVLTPKKSACGWDCKTCKKEFCSLIQAGSCEASKIVTSNNLVIQVTSPCLQAVGS